ncbi:MAG TPA: Gfo/Idh/MocA family oxidoreductase [Candidatus Paceibacterota bacterium]|nr:Gfo/Idh/MocA family oxidoreductase [Verrucomicrobiota bacterium]HRY52025.1 Gfo/Idh/MocA family oxidoreductase [Candidatus Paceibacterota bacterium]HRZ99659.1 Gfo/Idh/MocA family oxidoreductase [Candidatus Paceibacterota bacterium]
MSAFSCPEVVIIGGGMITHDLILPSVYHLQRLKRVGRLTVCALNNAPLRALRDSAELHQAFPGHEFRPAPAFEEPPECAFPGLYKEILRGLPPRQVVIVAVPDHFHYEVVREALAHNQHVLCVKPLVLKYEHALAIEEEARERGLFVGVEYHKRLDRRSLMARRQYGLGHFGEFVLGEAKLIEPYYYRHSNFQNWFTCDQTDPFVYVGCHYVDLVYFITGLKPVALSVSGVKGHFPNGNCGFLWSNGRVRYENGALLSVTDGLGYPDEAAGSNDQGLLMYCEGKNASGMIEHKDNDRGVRHCYLEGIGCGGSRYNYVSPDFYRLVPWEGPGFKPVGYGFESIAAHLEAMQQLETATAGMPENTALARRRELLAAIDRHGLLATPANSSINELVVEAARLSILNDGAWVDIRYEPTPHVALRDSRESKPA